MPPKTKVKKKDVEVIDLRDPVILFSYPVMLEQEREKMAKQLLSHQIRASFRVELLDATVMCLFRRCSCDNSKFPI